MQRHACDFANPPKANSANIRTDGIEVEALQQSGIGDPVAAHGEEVDASHDADFLVMEILEATPIGSRRNPNMCSKEKRVQHHRHVHPSFGCQ